MTVITPDERIIDNFDDGFGRTQVDWLSEPGGLTQFGSFIETLASGARSSIKHWHSDEDELVYVLEGEVTLHQGSEEHLLRPGDAAAFKAGDPVGHCLENTSRAPAKYLVVGTRAKSDTCTYPDHNRKCERIERDSKWLDLQGNPASNPYKEP